MLCTTSSFVGTVGISGGHSPRTMLLLQYDPCSDTLRKSPSTNRLPVRA